MSTAIAMVLALPVVGIALTALLTGRARVRLSLLLAAGIASSVLLLARSVLADGAAQAVSLRLPTGVEVLLVADGLASTLLLAVALGVLAQGLRHREDEWARRRLAEVDADLADFDAAAPPAS